MSARRSDLRAEITRLRLALKRCILDVYWMSGSADFAPGGKARTGWLKVLPRLKRLERLADGKEPHPHG